jgi:hypothetical protein
MKERGLKKDILCGIQGRPKVYASLIHNSERGLELLKDATLQCFEEGARGKQGVSSYAL